MLKKEIFIKNLSKIAPNMKQKEIAKIMGCQPATVSKYLSPERKDFPTVEMLCNLSTHFKVSIDWLLGMGGDFAKKKFTVRQACQSIVNLAHTFGLEYKNISLHESCYYYDDDQYQREAYFREADNQYTAIIISNWIHSDDTTDIQIFEQIGNYSNMKACINCFLEKFIRIEKMKADGMLPNDMYETLLKTYLDEATGFDDEEAYFE